MIGLMMSHFNDVPPAFDSLDDYLKLMDKAHSRYRTDVIKRAKETAAWGVPDHWSTGASQSELCSIIYQLIDIIEQQSPGN